MPTPEAVTGESTVQREALTALVIGGPTAILELGGLRLLTDPTFSPAGIHETTPGRPLTKTEHPAVDSDSVGMIDAVLLSHDQQADNLDPAGRVFLETVPLTLTTPAAAARLGGNDAAQAALILGATWVLPLHVRGWAHFSEGPEDFRKALDAAGLTDRLLDVPLGTARAV